MTNDNQNDVLDFRRWMYPVIGVVVLLLTLYNGIPWVSKSELAAYKEVITRELNEQNRRINDIEKNVENLDSRMRLVEYYQARVRQMLKLY